MATFSHTDNMNLLEAAADHLSIGGKVRYYRKYRKLKQEELSKITSIDVCTIKRIESNKSNPTIETCKKIAKALNIPPSFIYDEYLAFIDSNYPSFLKNIRKKLSLTQDQFAEYMGVSKKTISFWERKASYPKHENYTRLQEYLSKEGLCD